MKQCCLQRKLNRSSGMIIPIFILVSGFLGCAYFLFVCENIYNIALAFSWLLFTLILAILIEKRNDNLFEPIYLFSVMYITGCFSTWYLIATNFQTNKYVFLTEYEKPFTELFNMCVYYYFVGYVAFVLGYFLIKRNKTTKLMTFTSKNRLTDMHIKMVAFSCLILGFTNFFYNVYHFAGGDLLLYMKNISLRDYEFQTGGTTIAYHFIVSGVYFIEFLYLRNNKKFDSKFYFLLFATIIAIGSVGRIYYTLAVAAVVIVLKYFYSYQKGKEKNVNKKLFFIGILIMIFGIAFFLFRIITNFAVNGLIHESTGSFVKGQIEKIMYYAFDCGYTVNMAIFPKIVDAWNNEIGYLYGESFFTSLNSLFNTHIAVVSNVVRVTWFTGINDGNLPVTIIGDFFINFGLLGIIIGMLVFGMLTKTLYNVIEIKKSYWSILLYGIFIMHFVAIVAKCDFSNFPLFSLVFQSGMIFILKAFGQIKLSMGDKA